ncbi:MAG: ribosomal RNA small subunit methyltransferase A [Candidatus Omnitrophica bacterium]|nr:ribosomal RNA small subunit methyltransferase A [Candidatus Omnitrophota bacterium]
MPSQIELIKKYQLTIRGHSGQHLLIDHNIQKKIVNLLDPQPGETILEIGPGLGALTGLVLEKGARVLCIEKNERFTEVLREEYRDYLSGRLEIIYNDVLRVDFPEILKFQEDKRRMSRVKVLSNLPYYITAPILLKLLESSFLLSSAVLMMQREVAERLMAPPGDKNYGRLTLAVRYKAEVSRAFHVAPSCFTPRPEVGSTVTFWKFHQENDLLIYPDEKFLFRLIQISFQQRRKTLIHILTRASDIKVDRLTLEDILKKLGFAPAARGEELLLKDFMMLADELRKYKMSPS